MYYLGQTVIDLETNKPVAYVGFMCLEGKEWDTELNRLEKLFKKKPTDSVAEAIRVFKEFYNATKKHGEGLFARDESGNLITVRKTAPIRNKEGKIVIGTSAVMGFMGYLYDMRVPDLSITPDGKNYFVSK